MNMDSLAVAVTLDVIRCNDEKGFEWVKGRPVPRCVGGRRLRVFRPVDITTKKDIGGVLQ